MSGEWRKVYEQAFDTAAREARRDSLARKREKASKELASHLMSMPLAERELKILKPEVLGKLTQSDIAAVHGSMMRDAVREDRVKMVVGGVRRASRILRERLVHDFHNALSGAKGLTKDGFKSEGRIDLGEAVIAALRGENLFPNGVRFALAWMVSVGSLAMASGVGIPVQFHALIIQAITAGFVVAGWRAWKGLALRHAVVPLLVAQSLTALHWEAWTAGLAKTARINPALIDQPLAIAAFQSGMPLGPFVAEGTIWVVGLAWLGLVTVRLVKMAGIDLLGIIGGIINNKKTKGV